jgi:hypothetical protein
MKTKQTILFLLSCLLLFTQSIIPVTALISDKNTNNAQTKSSAQDLVRAALEAMGGEAKIRALKSIQFEGIGHTFGVEQSERPEGPWIVSYLQTSELRDLANGRIRTTTQLRHSQIPQWTGATQIFENGVAAFERNEKYFPGSFLQVETAGRNLALTPERILLKALEAPDLRLDKDAQMQNVSQRVVKFTWNKIPVTIYLNAGTNLPTAVETLNSSPYDYFWGVWGDYTERTFYTYWTLEQSGIRYPHQWDTERNNMPYNSFTITKFQLDAPVADKDFSIPDDVRQKFAALPKPEKIQEIPLGRPNRPAQEIAPGVVKLPGRWDVAFVKQSDGIVLIEAPISSGYSVKVLEEAKRRFPDSKVKAVITTSDAFPHLGGVREYAAREIPIYALDLNRPILERLLAAPHTFQPDSLQIKPRRANFKIVSGKTVLGDGANRLELYPIRTETGERMMMVYLPEHKLLYASDLVQKSLNGSFFMPQYLSEVLQAAEREKLEVSNVFAMHTDLTSWMELTNAVEKQIKGN